MSDHAGFSCPTPLPSRVRVQLGHGGGGTLSRELIEQVFLPAFDNPLLARLDDASILETADHPAGRIAFSTDAFVVRPRFFPGGSIGDLAINGTVNDLAMSGSQPRWISVAFVIEEGLPLHELETIAADMAAAARRAGVTIVTGDTKVVERGCGDGCSITTAGIGIMPTGLHLGPEWIRPGDAVIASGTIGDHGMAVMIARESLGFEGEIISDTASLGGLVATMLGASAGLRMLRDPTRGGVAACLGEIARLAGLGMEVLEESVPVRPTVAAACELLGLDPLAVANEGKLLAIVSPGEAEAVLTAMRSHEHGHEAVVLGHVVADHPGLVVMRTRMGTTRIIPMPLGEQLPRIC
jgi:hydrogenase expression/formation protein HypE